MFSSQQSIRSCCFTLRKLPIRATASSPIGVFAGTAARGPTRVMSSTSGPFRSKLIGAWYLVSYTSTNIKDSNDVKYPMHKDARGMILYTADGHMSAQLQQTDIPPYSKGAFQGTEKEFAESARKTMAYTGPFYLEEIPGNNQRLFHHMSLSQPPNWLGDTQLRLAEMSDRGEEGLFLTLGPESNTIDRGIERVVKLLWKKVDDNSGSPVPKDGSKL